MFCALCLTTFCCPSISLDMSKMIRRQREGERKCGVSEALELRIINHHFEFRIIEPPTMRATNQQCLRFDMPQQLQLQLGQTERTSKRCSNKFTICLKWKAARERGGEGDVEVEGERGVERQRDREREAGRQADRDRPSQLERDWGHHWYVEMRLPTALTNQQWDQLRCLPPLRTRATSVVCASSGRSYGQSQTDRQRGRGGLHCTACAALFIILNMRVDW